MKHAGKIMPTYHGKLVKLDGFIIDKQLTIIVIKVIINNTLNTLDFMFIAPFLYYNNP